jgi:hypothetical protein
VTYGNPSNLPLLIENSNKTINDIKTKIKREFFDTNRGNEILVNRTNLNLGDCIGRGNFGCIYKGFLNLAENETEVAVKRLENCEFLYFKNNYRLYQFY